MSASGFAYRRLEPYLNVARANFLALPVALVAVGAAAAWRSGTVDPFRTGLALAGLISLHVAVNAINEYSDYSRGIDQETDETPFSGGSGTLPEGELAPTSALYLGLLAAGVGAVIGAYFLYVVGTALLPIVAVGAVSVLFYTDFLTRIGVGEMAAGLGLGSLPVVGVALVQDGTVGTLAYGAAVPAFFLTFNLLLLNEFPDEKPDRRGGRTNLVHLLGRRWAAVAYVLAGLAVPASIVSMVALSVLPGLALVGVLPSVFLARPVRWGIGDPHSDVGVEALRDNVIWVLFTNVFLAVGIAMPAGAFYTTSGLSLNEGSFLLGRGLFGLVVFFMAFNNLADLENVTEKIAEAGVPYPKEATVASSIPLLFSGLSIMLGVYPAVGAAYFIVFMLVTTVTVHNFLGIEDPDEQDNEIFHFLKNLLILAAGLVFLSLALGGSEWPYSLGIGLGLLG